jgi:RecB family exonuclease
VKYSQPRRLKVTELEIYNRCPFQHFAAFALKPQCAVDGTGNLDRGAIYHRVISRAFRRKRDLGSTAAVTGQELEEILDEMAEEQRVDAARFRKGLMRRFLTQALRDLASREAAYSGPFQTRPKYFELAFGLNADDEESAQREYDPASRREPLTLPSEDGQIPVQICGAMDRVDLLGDSDAAMVVDFKTGGTPSYKSITAGESLQMPLYLMALEEVFGLKGAVACYDSAREPGRRRIFRTEFANMTRFGFQQGVDASGDFVKPLNEEEYRAAAAFAAARAAAAANNIRRADILPKPGDHCRYCDFGDFCRTTMDSTHDGQPFDVMDE